MNKLKVVQVQLRGWWRPTFAEGKGIRNKIRKERKRKRKRNLKSYWRKQGEMKKENIKRETKK